jgi:hypothetical protein
MTTLNKNMKCAVCGEVMVAGTAVRFEAVSYATANGGGYHRNQSTRYLPRHVGVCPKQQAVDYSEALEAARYYHDAALGHMFRGNMAKAKEAFQQAHTKVKIAKRIKIGA